MTLAELRVFTTDRKDNEQFFDRTLPENRNLPLYKLVILSNLTIY